MHGSGKLLVCLTLIMCPVPKCAHNLYKFDKKISTLTKNGGKFVDNIYIGMICVPIWNMNRAESVALFLMHR